MLLCNICHQVVDAVHASVNQKHREINPLASLPELIRFIQVILVCRSIQAACWSQKVKTSRFQNLIHVFMRLLHGLGGEAHVFKDFGVGVGIFQGFPLELNGRERPVDPGELLFIPLFPF